MRRLGAVLVAALMVVAACSNTDDDDGGGSGGPGESASYADVTTERDDENVPVDQPGVTDDEIRVAGLATLTNDLTNGNFGDIFSGVSAYFEMINQNGGIYGRQLVHEEFDDQLLNAQAAGIELLESEPFAVVGVATSGLAGASPDLVAAGIPVFGWNINQEFDHQRTFFGTRGYLGIGQQPNELVPWLGDEAGLSTLAVLAYGGAAAVQSQVCQQDIVDGIEQFDSAVELGFNDSSLEFGFADVSPQVRQMVDAGVDYVATCMDFQGHATIASEMQRQGLEAVHWLPRAYDPRFMDDFGDLFAGSYVHLMMLSREFEPRPPAMDAFEAWMAETGAGDEQLNELALAGWISADMFVTGLRIAGPDFTREAVIEGLNSLTDYTAQGLTPVIDWTREHDEDANGCQMLLLIEDGEFVPQFTEGDQPYVCVLPGEDGALEVSHEPIQHEDVGLIEMPE